MRPSPWLLLLTITMTLGCGGEPPSRARADVATRYTALVRATYADALATAEVLRDRVEALVRAPSAEGLAAARLAWRDAREPYSESEAFRFYEGPIDDPETGPEGRINGWPVDEAFIDSVVDAKDSGIIHDVSHFPTIDRALLAQQNGRGGETNIATGYHAIEFLLWGQDLSVDGPGARLHTDFLAGDGATRPHGDRRALYLSTVTQMLVDDLGLLVEAWKDQQGSYARAFQALSADEALGRMLRGMEVLAGDELAGERMRVAYTNQSQEDEQSCFSDNTVRDLGANLRGIVAVYRGGRAPDAGLGIDGLLQAADSDAYADMEAAVAEAEQSFADLASPFDRALTDEAERPTIRRAIDAMDALHAQIVATTRALGL